MNAPLAPALSAEEWEYYDGGGGALNSFGCHDCHDADMYPLMALANHALPDTHPGKITRADVGDIAYAARQLDSYMRYPATVEALQSLAAKLRALLPPEG